MLDWPQIVLIMSAGFLAFWGSSYMATSFDQDDMRTIITYRILSLFLFVSASYLIMLATASYLAGGS